VALTIPCSHTFCSPCLKKWISQKTNCPLCLTIIEKIDFKTNGKVCKTLSPSSLACEAKPLSEKDSFECFDHAYFFKEYEKLSYKAKDLEFTIKSNHSKIYYESESWAALDNLKQDITRKVKMMRELKKYEAKYLLDDLIMIDKTMKQIADGEFESELADDYDENCYECDEYTYYEEDGHEEKYEEEIEVHIATYLKKNNMTLYKLDKNSATIQNTSVKKKKKPKKAIKVQ